jgi:PadR family transcriptional regulator AphA
MSPAEPARAAVEADLSLAEQVVLALAVAGAGHGWAMVRDLAPDGELGRIWHLSRPLTYRAIDTLADKGLLRRRATEREQGRARVVIGPTAAGRRVVQRWLDTPVSHVRDVRTELLVKLVLRTRAGLDNRQFLIEQRRVLEPIIEALVDRRAGDDLVAEWRAENARAVRRFLDRAIAGSQRGEPLATAAPVAELHLSARNQLRGTVRRVRRDGVLASVVVALPDGQAITAVITSDAVAELDIAPGDAVVAIVKSTEVMIAKA